MLKYIIIFSSMIFIVCIYPYDGHHYVSFGLYSGPSFSGEFYKGACIGISSGYQYQLQDNIAIGTGISGHVSVMQYKLEKTILVGDLGYIEYKYDFITSTFFGITAMFTLMSGNLEKIAFLFDIGGGWLFSAKVGINLYGFEIKSGYFLSADINYFELSHTVTIEAGYKFTIKNKKMKEKS